MNATMESGAIEQLEAFEIFEGFGRTELERLAAAIQPQSFEAGECLIVEGDRSRRLYGVLEGRVEVLKTDDAGDRRRLAVLEPKTVLGEHGFVLGEPRTATIRALDAVEALALDGQSFDRLDAERSDITRRIEHNILRLLAHRQTQINRELLELLDEREGENSYHCDETNDLGDQLMQRWTV